MRCSRKTRRPPATRIRNIAAQADSLSDVERQSLSRALQRAANVGRSDARSANALRNAAQAISSGAFRRRGALAGGGGPARLDPGFAVAGSRQRSRPATARPADPHGRRHAAHQLTPTSCRASPQPPTAATAIWPAARPSRSTAALASRPSRSRRRGRPRAELAWARRQTEQARRPSLRRRRKTSSCQADPATGRPTRTWSTSLFRCSGAPRPYRDVLSQYAQSSRDYVDRPDISPAVRDLVKQYFQELENSQ